MGAFLEVLVWVGAAAIGTLAGIAVTGLLVAGIRSLIEGDRR